MGSIGGEVGISSKGRACRECGLEQRRLHYWGGQERQGRRKRRMSGVGGWRDWKGRMDGLGVRPVPRVNAGCGGRHRGSPGDNYNPNNEAFNTLSGT